MESRAQPDVRVKANRTLNTILFGFLGGTVGAAAAGIVAYAFSLVSYNDDPVFVLASDLVGRRTSVFWITGWGLHLIFGMAIGGVAGLAITRNSQLLTKTTDRKVFTAVVIGMITWLLLFIPALAIPSSAAASGSALASLPVTILFGAIIVIMWGVSQTFMMFESSEERRYICRVCGRSFSSNSRFERHKLRKHPELEAQEKVVAGAPRASPTGPVA